MSLCLRCALHVGARMPLIAKMVRDWLSALAPAPANCLMPVVREMNAWHAESGSPTTHPPYVHYDYAMQAGLFGFGGKSETALTADDPDQVCHLRPPLSAWPLQRAG